MHMRLAPKKHKFNYRVFSLFRFRFINDNTNSYKFLKLNRFGLLSLTKIMPVGLIINKTMGEFIINQNNLPKADKIFLLSFPRILIWF